MSTVPQLPEGLVFKPAWRGWLHAVTFPVAVATGIALVALSPTPHMKIANAVFALTASMMFGVSALFHRRQWSDAARAVIRRLDHATIFLIIAGTYTPFTLALLDGGARIALLSIVWVGALAGVAFRVFWLGAPRWLYTPVYVALGWAAAFWLPDFWANGGVAVFTLVAVGGLFYTLGAVIYALQRPNPLPRVFGFHEVFHAFTVAAFATHMTAAWLAAFEVGFPTT